jgi:predicted nuclease of restriction endonuclease-like (RecB) superfamily
MTAFGRQRPGESIASQPGVQLLWGHLRTILCKTLGPDARRWYAAAAVEYGWSRNVLRNMITNKSMERSGAASSNVSRRTSPAACPQRAPNSPSRQPRTHTPLSSSDSPEKSPSGTSNRHVWTASWTHSGNSRPGFAFVRRQVHFEVEGDDLYIDLLFVRLEQLRYFETVGILICGSKNDHTVRYASAVPSHRWPCPPTPTRTCRPRSNAPCGPPTNSRRPSTRSHLEVPERRGSQPLLKPLPDIM